MHHYKGVSFISKDWREIGMIIEISVAVIAAAFVALVIYLIILMSTLRQNLRQTKRILETTDEISLDLRNKMEALDPFFHTLTNLGEVLENKTELFKRYVINPIEPEARLKQDANEDFEKDILQFAGSGIRLFKNLKRR